jgi:transglutaminase-like putative cysteine protease
MFYYFPQKKGYLKYVIDSFGFTYRSYSIIDPGDAIQHSDIYRFSGNARFELWAMKDVPALKLENYTSTNKNYLSKISFDLISIRYSDSHTQYIVSGWSKTAADVLKMPDYSIIKENNSWMKDDLKTIVAGATKDEEKTRKIYAYIRDNFTCNDHDAIRASQPLKKTFQSKSGNVADISVLLMAMLYNQGIESSPVFLSTRENGWANVDWALLNDYNYVLARVKLDSTYYLLDASQSWLGFGKIAGECLNGFGRVIDPKKPLLIPLDPDSIVEKKSTVVFIINDSTLGSVGSYSSNLGYYESLELRDKLAKEKQEDYIY